MKVSTQIRLACSLIVGDAMPAAMEQQLPLAECISTAFTAWWLNYISVETPTDKDHDLRNAVKTMLFVLFPELKD